MTRVPDDMLAVPYAEATNRQLLLYLVDLVTTQGELMSELSTEITELKASVVALKGRVDTLAGPLRVALEAAQADLANARTAAAALAAAESEEDVQQNADLTAALDAAQGHVDEIQAAVGELDEITADLDTVAQPPAEPTP